MAEEKKKDGNLVSESIKEGFSVYNIPFIGCDYEKVYPAVFSVLPKERVTFEDFDLDTRIMSEVVCAAICHQINWDFLREELLKYTEKNPAWLLPSNLAAIKANAIGAMLGSYHKAENVKADERAKILHSVGNWAGQYEAISDVFLDDGGKLKPKDEILQSLLACTAFSSDPEEKKMNLLLQKLETILALQGIGNYAKPAIDYHLLRFYLRRGLLFARTQKATDYVSNPDVERKESTVAGVRELVSQLLVQTARYTVMDIISVNLVDWHVARSVCTRECPDCNLSGQEAQWLKPLFERCPFYTTCMAKYHQSDKILSIVEPSYKGTSY